MGVRLIADITDDLVALYDSTEMVAFGPVFDSEEAARDFLNEWLPNDARSYSKGQLLALHSKWHEHAYDEDGDFVGAGRKTEPTDDEIYNRAVYVPDARDEHDPSL